MSVDGAPAWIDQVLRTRDSRSTGGDLIASGRIRRISHGGDCESSRSRERTVGVIIQRMTRATVRGLREEFRKAVRNVSMELLRLNN